MLSDPGYAAIKNDTRKKMTHNSLQRRKASIAAMTMVVSALISACGTESLGNTGAMSVPGESATPDANLNTSLPVKQQQSESSDSNMNLSPVINALSTGAQCNSSEPNMRLRMLELINAARSEPRNCGGEAFPASDPLAWNDELMSAATQHSEDMASHNFFSHTGSDGSSVADRIDRAGYRWRNVGENIAAGRDNAADTVSDWLGSPGHCKNLMNPAFTEMAVACVESGQSDFKRYWTNTLGTPQ